MDPTSKIFFLFFCYFVFGGVHSNGQVNLVVNPSLEDHSLCPDNDSEIDYANGWSSFWFSPDYYNACGVPGYSVPNNLEGFQVAASGFAYGGIISFLSGTIGPNTREFVGGSLTLPLTPGIKYFVSFKVSFIFNSVINCNCAINNLGANFSTLSYGNFDPFPPFPITNTAKVNENNIITDTAGWTQIFGSFIADSAYQYIVIGNFFDDNNTDTLIMDAASTCKIAYHYFDDVCVSTDSVFALNYTYVGIPNEEDNNNLIEILPNPVIDYLEANNKSDFSLEFIICDNLGRTVFKGYLTPNNKNLFDLSSFESGIYSIYFLTKHNYITKKLIKL